MDSWTEPFACRENIRCYDHRFRSPGFNCILIINYVMNGVQLKTAGAW
jgi:hypothetical protein